MTAPQPGEVEVEDQLERRIRKPVDLLRCVLSCVGIVALAVAGVAASATTSGAETDIAGASRRLPHPLLVVAASRAGRSSARSTQLAAARQRGRNRLLARASAEADLGIVVRQYPHH